MKNYTVTYEMDSDPSETYTWSGDGVAIGDALYNFYHSSDEFNYETPVVINIVEEDA
jgi:hypothetical protein